MKGGEKRDLSIALQLSRDRSHRGSDRVEAGAMGRMEKWSWEEQRTWELKRLKSKERRTEEEGEGRHLHCFWSLKLVSPRSILR